jgi:hypothetical protein
MMRLPTAAELNGDACALRREKVTAISGAVSPSNNCAIKFQQFMVSLRIIQKCVSGFSEAQLEHSGEQTAICSNSNGCMMAASQVKSNLRFHYIIATTARTRAATN